MLTSWAQWSRSVTITSRCQTHALNAQRSSTPVASRTTIVQPVERAVDERVAGGVDDLVAVGDVLAAEQDGHDGPPVNA